MTSTIDNVENDVVGFLFDYLGTDLTGDGLVGGDIWYRRKQRTYFSSPCKPSGLRIKTAVIRVGRFFFN